jgi:RNA polymerase sigma-70 factor (ECF subfamily)
MAPPNKSARRADFEALYERHGREVWALVYARWFNPDLALDITQETFLRYWKQCERGESIENPRAWLMRVARNLAEDQGRSAFHRNGTHPPQALNGVPSREPMPLERLEKEELLVHLRQVLAELPAADREILTLRYALDYDTARIAGVLGVNPSAVHMRLSRARNRAAQRLVRREPTL